MLFFSEPFLESVPQVHILLPLALSNEHLFIESLILFIVTFTTSVLSASLGIAKFLKLGPCRLIPNEGILGGFGSLSFLMLLFNVLSTIVAKGLILVGSGSSNRYSTSPGLDLFRDDYNTFKGVKYLLWITLCILPQLIYVCYKYLS